MTDWTKVHAFAKHSYIQSFPVTSFLVSGVSFYKEIIKEINIEDILEMIFESNKFDSSAIAIKKDSHLCGYVPKDIKEKIKKYVPGKVKVIDKRYIENDIYSIRVDVVHSTSLPSSSSSSITG